MSLASAAQARVQEGRVAFFKTGRVLPGIHPGVCFLGCPFNGLDPDVPRAELGLDPSLNSSSVASHFYVHQTSGTPS